MKKKAIIITGGVSRVGKIITEFFATRGYSIVLTYNKSGDSFHELKDRLEFLYNIQIFGLKVDFLDINETKEFFCQFTNFILKKKDEYYFTTLFNNASIFCETQFVNTNFDLIDNLLKIHVSVPMNLIQIFNSYCIDFIDCMKSEKTKHIIVNFCDFMVLQDNINKYFFYTLSKKFLYDSSSFIRKKLSINVSLVNILPKKIMDDNNILLSDNLYKVLKSIEDGSFFGIEKDQII